READRLELAHGQSQQSPPNGKPDARPRSALHAERHRGYGTRDCCQPHYTGENGEKREEVTFVDVTVWGRTAENVGEYLKKGRPVFIEGRLQLDSWEDKQSGQKRNKLRVVADNVQFLGSRSGGGGGPEEGGEAPRSSLGSGARKAPPPKGSEPAEPDD